MDDFDDFLTGPPSTDRNHYGGGAQSSGQYQHQQYQQHQPQQRVDDPFSDSFGFGPPSHTSTLNSNYRGNPPPLLDDGDLMRDGGDSFTGTSSRTATLGGGTSGSSTLAAGAPYQQSGGVLASVDSGLPFAAGGVTPAGHHSHTSPFEDAYAVAGGLSMNGNFKSIEADDELSPSEEYNHKSFGYGGRAASANGSAAGNGGRGPGYGSRSVNPFSRGSTSGRGLPAAMRKKKRAGKGGPFEGVRRTMQSMNEDFRRAWGKQPTNRVLEGERIVQLNDSMANELQKFCDNYVSTGKYNVVTFVPKFLFEQFSKYANLFFLFTACIQQIPGVSPTNRYTTVVPLILVLLATAYKEMKEDRKRHSADAELNSRLAQVLEPGTGSFELRKWKDIEVGDIVRVESNEFFPADLVLLSSSEPEGLCYVETANLDGETNLKIKQASPDTARLTTPSAAAALRGNLTSEQPNNSLYTFDATLNIQLSSTPGFSGTPMRKVPLSPEQLLLRGAQLRNTPWAYGLVVFTGHETKLMRNATAAPVKRTTVEKQVNTLILLLFVLLLALSLASAIGAIVRNTAFTNEMQYLLLTDDARGKARTFVEDTLTFIIAYNNLIPISLIVMMEVVKYQQAIFINSDLDMYYAPTDTPALCRTSSLVEELGQIEYIFSDKTGTLTRNEMEFRQASIGGYSYTDVIDESKQGTGEIGPDGREIGGQRTWHELRAIMDGTMPDDGTSALIDEFLTMLAVCHTVIPERKGDKVIFQASSPDEAALVAGAEGLGYQFVTRKPRSVFVNVRGRELEYEVLNVCEFNSTRKRMSTIIRGPDGKIKLYCKGADTVIMARLSEKQPFLDTTVIHLEDYATEGLRTLCIAMREISEQEYRQWSKMYDQAAAQIQGRGEALDKAAEVIEQNMFLLGATAIEDKLQEGVPETIHTLQTAGIKVWVLTGDRQETAINIGLSCKLISESMNLIIVNEETPHDTADFLTKRLNAVKSQRSVGEIEEFALIIDGKSLGYALEKDISQTFLELAIMCKAVVCCRVSPLQKALVVKLVKKNRKSILLAIGDGANDVSMIQAAHVGVGISGVEGLQAARSADVAISQFRYLRKLLLVHGTWSYTRLSKMILYSFYKNIVLYMTQFWYSFSNSFSGNLSMEGWTLSFFNIMFTVAPPLILGVFDQHISARLLDQYPQLYGQTFFSKRKFLGWTINAFYHSFLCYLFVTVMFWGTVMLQDGYNSYQWIWGTTLFVTVLNTVLGKAALETKLWTKYTFAAIPGSFVFTILFLILYAIIAPSIPRLHLSLEYYHIVPRLFGLPLFWFCIILVPVVCLLRDFVWKYFIRTYRPKSYHIIQEVQKYQLQDYRPRMDQFQKAIRKVRAVQRMRRTRGFAFSQTEGEQERLIRKYDTSISRPTGL